MLASRLLTAAKVQNKGKTITTTINKRQARAVLLTWSWCPERNPSSASCKESYRRVVLAARLLFALLRSALTASFTRSPRWRLSLARAARSQSERSTTRWLTSDDQEQEVRVTLFCSFFFLLLTIFGKFYYRKGKCVEMSEILQYFWDERNICDGLWTMICHVEIQQLSPMFG